MLLYSFQGRLSERAQNNWAFARHSRWRNAAAVQMRLQFAPVTLMSEEGRSACGQLCKDSCNLHLLVQDQPAPCCLDEDSSQTQPAKIISKTGWERGKKEDRKDEKFQHLLLAQTRPSFSGFAEGARVRWKADGALPSYSLHWGK